MTGRRYPAGDAVGAVSVPLSPVAGTGDRAVVVRLKNVGDLLKSQGGAAGALAYGAVPQTMTDVVYGKLRAELEQKLREQGVDADVQVTYTPPQGGRSPRDLLVGAALCGGFIGLAAFFWRRAK